MTHQHHQIRPRESRYAHAARAVAICLRAVQLRRINFSLPEIQTPLEGVTVDGHALSDQQIAVNRGNVWRKLLADIHGRAIWIFSTMTYQQFLHSCFDPHIVTIMPK